MSDPVEPLIVDLLEWIGRAPRPFAHPVHQLGELQHRDGLGSLGLAAAAVAAVLGLGHTMLAQSDQVHRLA